MSPDGPERTDPLIPNWQKETIDKEHWAFNTGARIQKPVTPVEIKYQPTPEEIERSALQRSLQPNTELAILYRNLKLAQQEQQADSFKEVMRPKDRAEVERSGPGSWDREISNLERLIAIAQAVAPKRMEEASPQFASDRQAQAREYQSQRRTVTRIARGFIAENEDLNIDNLSKFQTEKAPRNFKDKPPYILSAAVAAELESNGILDSANIGYEIAYQNAPERSEKYRSENTIQIVSDKATYAGDWIRVSTKRLDEIARQVNSALIQNRDLSTNPLTEDETRNALLSSAQAGEYYGWLGQKMGLITEMQKTLAGEVSTHQAEAEKYGIWLEQLKELIGKPENSPELNIMYENDQKQFSEAREVETKAAQALADQQANITAAINRRNDYLKYIKSNSRRKTTQNGTTTQTPPPSPPPGTGPTVAATPSSQPVPGQPNRPAQEQPLQDPINVTKPKFLSLHWLRSSLYGGGDPTQGSLWKAIFGAHLPADTSRQSGTRDQDSGPVGSSKESLAEMERSEVDRAQVDRLEGRLSDYDRSGNVDVDGDGRAN